MSDDKSKKKLGFMFFCCSTNSNSKRHRQEKISNSYSNTPVKQTNIDSSNSKNLENINAYANNSHKNNSYNNSKFYNSINNNQNSKVLDIKCTIKKESTNSLKSEPILTDTIKNRDYVNKLSKTDICDNSNMITEKKEKHVKSNSKYRESYESHNIGKPPKNPVKHANPSNVLEEKNNNSLNKITEDIKDDEIADNTKDCNIATVSNELNTEDKEKLSNFKESNIIYSPNRNKINTHKNNYKILKESQLTSPDKKKECNTERFINSNNDKNNIIINNNNTSIDVNSYNNGNKENINLNIPIIDNNIVSNDKATTLNSKVLSPTKIKKGSYLNVVNPENNKNISIYNSNKSNVSSINNTNNKNNTNYNNISNEVNNKTSNLKNTYNNSNYNSNNNNTNRTSKSYNLTVNDLKGESGRDKEFSNNVNISNNMNTNNFSFAGNNLFANYSSNNKFKNSENNPVLVNYAIDPARDIIIEEDNNVNLNNSISNKLENVISKNNTEFNLNSTDNNNRTKSKPASDKKCPYVSNSKSNDLYLANNKSQSLSKNINSNSNKNLGNIIKSANIKNVENNILPKATNVEDGNAVYIEKLILKQDVKNNCNTKSYSIENNNKNQHLISNKVSNKSIRKNTNDKNKEGENSSTKIIKKEVKFNQEVVNVSTRTLPNFKIDNFNPNEDYKNNISSVINNSQNKHNLTTNSLNHIDNFPNKNSLNYKAMESSINNTVINNNIISVKSKTHSIVKNDSSKIMYEDISGYDEYVNDEILGDKTLISNNIVNNTNQVLNESTISSNVMTHIIQYKTISNMKTEGNSFYTNFDNYSRLETNNNNNTVTNYNICEDINNIKHNYVENEFELTSNYNPSNKDMVRTFKYSILY